MSAQNKMTGKAFQRWASNSVHLNVLVCGVILAVTVSARAQNVWTRPYQQWTKDEIIKIASDSPWAQVQQASSTTGERVPLAYVPGVTIRLRSALPIREALVRLKQIEGKYDKLDAAGRTALDERTKGVLGCPACTENYIVTLGPPVSTRGMKSGIYSLRNIAFGLLEKRVYLLNDRGERRELIHFVAPKTEEDEATFFFPRLDEKGNPLLTNESRKLVFIFETRNIRTTFGLDSIPERFEFDVSRLVLDGKIEF